MYGRGLFDSVKREAVDKIGMKVFNVTRERIHNE